MTVRKDDWRLTGQAQYLQKAKLYWKQYSRYKDHADHDHCEFCWAQFMVEDHPDVLHAGWATEDNYRWICNNCFNDFKETFEFEIGCLQENDSAI